MKINKKYDRLYSGQIKYVTQEGILDFTKHPLYFTWRMMNIRCYDDRHKAYHRYGGRGVSVCTDWRFDNRFGMDNFIRYVGDRPEGTTLDRINNNLGYEVGNVRWVCKRTQQNNIGTGLANTSGHIGVQLVKNYYVVTIMLNGKGKTIGTYPLNKFEEACILYDKVRDFKINHTDNETMSFIKSFIPYTPENKRVRINKTSKYFGVSWDSSRSKWRAMCSYRETIDGELINKMVGRFDSEEEAYNSVLKFLEWVKENGYFKKSVNRN